MPRRRRLQPIIGPHLLWTDSEGDKMPNSFPPGRGPLSTEGTSDGRYDQLIVIVGNDPVVAHSLASLLRRRGWGVDIAGTVADAEPYLDRDPPWMLLDLTLPEGGGDELIRSVAAKGLTTRIVVITDGDDHELLHRVEQLEPEAILFKPVPLNVILTALEAHLTAVQINTRRVLEATGHEAHPRLARDDRVAA